MKMRDLQVQFLEFHGGFLDGITIQIPFHLDIPKQDIQQIIFKINSKNDDEVTTNHVEYSENGRQSLCCLNCHRVRRVDRTDTSPVAILAFLFLSILLLRIIIKAIFEC